MRSFASLLLLAVVTIPGGSYAQDTASQANTAVSEPSSQATVYFYRYKQFVGSALTPSVYCDEDQLARIENGRFFAVHIAPGKHSFRSNDKQAGIELDLKGGEQYFIRVEIATGMMKGHGRLVLMPAEQGNYELKSKQLKVLDADRVIDKTRVSVEGSSHESSENRGAEAK
jgi:hypothetical protein